MAESNGGTRNTTTILRDALEELEARRDRLQPFVAELADVHRCIKVLERALQQSPQSRSKGLSQRARALACIRNSFDPLTPGQISEATEIPRASVYAALSTLKAAGEIIEMEGKYGMPVTSVEAME